MKFTTETRSHRENLKKEKAWILISLRLCDSVVSVVGRVA